MLGQERFFRNHVNGAQGFLQSGDRFQIADNAHLFSIRDTALDAAGAIGQMVESALVGVIGDLVMGVGSSAVGDANALADLDGLHGIHAHDCLRQPAVEPRVPARVGTKT